MDDTIRAYLEENHIDDKSRTMRSTTYVPTIPAERRGADEPRDSVNYRIVNSALNKSIQGCG